MKHICCKQNRVYNILLTEKEDLNLQLFKGLYTSASELDLKYN